VNKFYLANTILNKNKWNPTVNKCLIADFS